MYIVCIFNGGGHLATHSTVLISAIRAWINLVCTQMSPPSWTSLHFPPYPPLWKLSQRARVWAPCTQLNSHSYVTHEMYIFHAALSRRPTLSLPALCLRMFSMSISLQPGGSLCLSIGRLSKVKMSVIPGSNTGLVQVYQNLSISL